MHWFRSNIRLCSRLALFALAVADGIVARTRPSLCRAPASAQIGTAGRPDGSGAGLLSTRTPIHKSDGSIDPYCPICAFIQLLTTSAPSAAPALPLPATLGLIGLQAPAELALCASVAVFVSSPRSTLDLK